MIENRYIHRYIRLRDNMKDALYVDGEIDTYSDIDDVDCRLNELELTGDEKVILINLPGFHARWGDLIPFYLSEALTPPVKQGSQLGQLVASHFSELNNIYTPQGLKLWCNELDIPEFLQWPTEEIFEEFARQQIIAWEGSDSSVLLNVIDQGPTSFDDSNPVELEQIVRDNFDALTPMLLEQEIIDWAESTGSIDLSIWTPIQVLDEIDLQWDEQEDNVTHNSFEDKNAQSFDDSSEHPSNEKLLESKVALYFDDLKAIYNLQELYDWKRSTRGIYGLFQWDGMDIIDEIYRQRDRAGIGFPSDPGRPSCR